MFQCANCFHTLYDMTPRIVLCISTHVDKNMWCLSQYIHRAYLFQHMLPCAIYVHRWPLHNVYFFHYPLTSCLLRQLARSICAPLFCCMLHQVSYIVIFSRQPTRCCKLASRALQSRLRSAVLLQCALHCSIFTSCIGLAHTSLLQ